MKNFIQQKYFNLKLLKKFKKEFEAKLEKIKLDFHNSSKLINTLNNNYKFNFKIKDLKNFNKYNTIAIIGMGGSILGSKAIYYSFRKQIKKKVYFFDDINVEKINFFKKKINTKKVLFLVISKSGNTVETISNLISLKIIKKSSQNIIIISEKSDNFLFSISKKLDLFFIEHKKFVGGRFSVLSEVGIIPAYLMGINVIKLRKNLSKFLLSKNKNFLRDSTTKLAYFLKKNHFNNLVFLNYAPELENFLYWYQQLIAESLGKKGIGFLPVVSNVPTDHHSLLQLYLDGPKNKLFYIFNVEKNSKEKINLKFLSQKNSFLNKKSLTNIKNAQKDALIKTLIKNELPFREFNIKHFNETKLGELFSYFILETILVAQLCKINPFDQPAVEQVKKYTKELLS